MSLPTAFTELGPADSKVAERVFEFVQFLLDDDTNLTPTGNLTSASRQKFRTRLEEIITADESTTTETPLPADAAEAP